MTRKIVRREKTVPRSRKKRKTEFHRLKVIKHEITLCIKSKRKRKNVLMQEK